MDDERTIAAALRDANVPCFDAIASLATPSVRLATARVEEADIALGASRFGGSPDVPRGFEWPTCEGEPLSFLVQIDLSTFVVDGLPASGWLLFFYDVGAQPWGFDPADAGGARVVFVDEVRDALERVPHPPMDDTCGPFEWCEVSVTVGMDLPSAMDRVLLDAGLGFEDFDAADHYESVSAAITGVGHFLPCLHHLLGHPQEIQGDMRGECQLVTNGLSCGDGTAYRSDRGKALLRDCGAEWQLLLQLDSDEEGPGFMWGDLGRLYFWIRHTDLAARDFAKTWLVLQCG